MHDRLKLMSENDVIQNSYAESAYHVLPFAVCTLDKDLNVVWANKNFNTLIASSAPTSRDQLLFGLVSPDNLKIREMLKGRSDSEVIRFAQECEDDKILSFTVIHRVFNEYATFFVAPKTSPDAILDQALLEIQKNHRLSNAELSIAKLLATGISVDQIAYSRQVSIATVRAQLRHLREKMDANTSMEVVIKIYTACLHIKGSEPVFKP